MLSLWGQNMWPSAQQLANQGKGQECVAKEKRPTTFLPGKLALAGGIKCLLP